jgi:hypothetical protein
MQKYQWAIRVTTEYWKDGSDWVPLVDIRECRDEAEARPRYDAIADMLANPRAVAAKTQRIVAVELIKRPVGEWETIA